MTQSLHPIPRPEHKVSRRPQHLRDLEAESVHILREVIASMQRPVVLYSVGKDSSALLRLVQKAAWPGKIPIPLMHVDTGYKFPEMYAFRDQMAREVGFELIVAENQPARQASTNPWDQGTERCCALLKTQPLVEAIRRHGFDAAIGGARRDEEKSRAKERVFSHRDVYGQWDPKSQRPELWNLYNSRILAGEHLRVFPMSNWTELDVWHYIASESIPISPLYFAQEREVVEHANGSISLLESLPPAIRSSAKTVRRPCRFRTLGCAPCTGPVPSTASSVEEIILELQGLRNSERAGRAIDHDREGSMERKKREGYF